MIPIAKRKLGSIYIPPVELAEDKDYFDSMFDLHCEQKLLFRDLQIGEVNHEEVLEALEVYIGTKQMDSYIEATEQELDKLEENVLWLTS